MELSGHLYPPAAFAPNERTPPLLSTRDARIHCYPESNGREDGRGF